VAGSGALDLSVLEHHTFPLAGVDGPLDQWATARCAACERAERTAAGEFTDLTSYPAMIQQGVQRPIEQRWMAQRPLARIMDLL
jgi:hypothetical protein